MFNFNRLLLRLECLLRNAGNSDKKYAGKHKDASVVVHINLTGSP